MASTFVSSLYFQQAPGHSPLLAVLAFLPMTAMVGGIAIWVGASVGIAGDIRKGRLLCQMRLGQSMQLPAAWTTICSTAQEVQGNLRVEDQSLRGWRGDSVRPEIRSIPRSSRIAFVSGWLRSRIRGPPRGPDDGWLTHCPGAIFLSCDAWPAMAVTE
jgi:hypothetical protein